MLAGGAGAEATCLCIREDGWVGTSAPSPGRTLVLSLILWGLTEAAMRPGTPVAGPPRGMPPLVEPQWPCRAMARPIPAAPDPLWAQLGCCGSPAHSALSTRVVSPCGPAPT